MTTITLLVTRRGLFLAVTQDPQRSRPRRPEAGNHRQPGGLVKCGMIKNATPQYVSGYHHQLTTSATTGEAA